MPDQTVAAVTTGKSYPVLSPYHPSSHYPEYPFTGISPEPNNAYDGVRRLFECLMLDRENRNTEAWNPLGFLIQPGMKVVLKPNFVLSRHGKGKDLYSIVTHPSVLRAIADYCWIALKGQGSITIADAPQYDCNFEELMEATGLPDVCNYYAQQAGPEVAVVDLRKYWSKWKHFPSMLLPLNGDPKGSMTVNLGKDSALYGKVQNEKLYGAVYHREETISHHTAERHEYELSRTIMDADVVISVPKLKVHKKVGVTLNAKGLVGIATNKNFLVHYTLTPPSEGGDQYPDNLLTPAEKLILKTERWMYDNLLAHRNRSLEYLHRSVYWIHNHSTRKLGLKVDESKRLLDAGNWHGNDSAWRMTMDLMRCFYFADGSGKLQNSFQRNMFSVIDGIIGGERNGPLLPDPKAAGVLIAGRNLLATDLVAARLMGFDPLRLKLYSHALSDRKFDFGVRSLEDITVLSDTPAFKDCLTNRSDSYLNFIPHPGWVGNVEIQQQQEECATI